MTGPTLLVAVLGAAGILLAAFLYVRGEVAVPGKSLLLALRVGALAVVILLLLDVRLPGDDPARPGTGAGVWMLLDPDLSLLVPGEGAGSLWDDAVSRAQAEAERGARLALAGPGGRGPEGTDAAALRIREPDHPPGDLVEGVVQLGEAGADSVVVLSSFRRPPAFLERLERELPVPVRLEPLGGTVRNAGVAELDLPARLRPGEPVEGRVSVFAEGGLPGDTVEVEIRGNGELLQLLRLPLPGPGETAVGSLFLPPLPDTGTVRFTARAVLEGDLFAPDDLRARWASVGEAEGGIFLLSLRPDWEPRFLLPVLRAVTGLEGEGMLALGEGRFLPLADGGEEVSVVGPEAFRERLSRARLLVLHGAGAQVPPWVREVVAAHPRVLHLPAAPDGAELAGIGGTVVAAGEWVPDPELPASPVAPFLSGIRLGGLPPLASLLVPSGGEGIVALGVRGAAGAGAGATGAALLLHETEEGRRAIAMAQGFWRWGSREGDAREAYRALWGGAAEWLLARSDLLAGEGVRPVDPVQPRGEPLRWEVGTDGRGATLLLTAAFPPGEEPPVSVPPVGEPGPEALEADVVFRGTLDPGPDGQASTPPIAPGVYRYEVRAPGGEMGPDATQPGATQPGPVDPGAAEPGTAQPPPLAAGWVEIERWAPSLRLPPLTAAEGTFLPSEAVRRAGPEGGRPLRTHPLPYLLALLLLCAEWIGRRRAGLR